MQDMHSVGGGGGRFFIGGAGGGDRRIRTHHHNHALVAAAAKCPRCDSGNTKFCYYNNYNLSQPRHFCKSCRRYWTKGGVLRHVPIGGGCRKSKRPASKPNPHQEKGEEAAKSSEKPPIISQAAPNNNSCSSDSLSPSASAIEIASNPRSAVAVSDLMNGVLDSVSISVSAPEAVTESSTLNGTSVCTSNSFSGLINGTGNSNLYGHAGGIKWTAVINGHGSASDGGDFPEIGSLASLIPQPSDQTTVLSFGGRTVNQIQAQQENEVGILYDPFHGRSFFGNGGFGPLDWRTSASEDQGLFDTVDQTYWSQSQWSRDEDQINNIFP